MREILFRGKTKVYNKWVYGWYCGKILSEDMSRTEESSQIIDDKTLYWHTCEAETVGQFTGITDKNGKKVFDGDVIKAIASNPVGEDIEATVIVSLDDYELMWDIEHSHEIEVIGNIHDNP
jgi:uncharacterized phage protein (TIGR01671 family)